MLFLTEVAIEHVRRYASITPLFQHPEVTLWAAGRTADVSQAKFCLIGTMNDAPISRPTGTSGESISQVVGYLAGTNTFFVEVLSLLRSH